MLRNVADMKGLTIHAIEDEIGMLDHFYFDDQTWTVRYLVVDTGGWLSGLRGHLVLVSPYSTESVDWHARRLNVKLTKKQVAESPDIDTYKPVSRQHEAQLNLYYGYPPYWNGTNLWGAEFSPLEARPLAQPAQQETVQQSETDIHLRSTQEVQGYSIHSKDGEIGHVAGFVVDDETWAVRYLEVATKNWWPGKKVLVPPSWITGFDWAEAKVSVDLNREVLRNSPEYDESVPISREYEEQLYQHYGRPPYWSPMPLLTR